MGKALRKREQKVVAPSPLDPHIMQAWHSGYSQGASEQRKSDIENVVQLLENLEEIDGIGEKTAWKIRKLFLDLFGN
ncbi:hypothetical protein JMM81_12475 [Bacillus sp. V3B]|nr:hypothetical protein [Bacillus sp. V3B]